MTKLEITILAVGCFVVGFGCCLALICWALDGIMKRAEELWRGEA